MGFIVYLTVLFAIAFQFPSFAKEVKPLDKFTAMQKAERQKASQDVKRQQIKLKKEPPKTLLKNQFLPKNYQVTDQLRGSSAMFDDKKRAVARVGTEALYERGNRSESGKKSIGSNRAKVAPPVAKVAPVAKVPPATIRPRGASGLGNLLGTTRPASGSFKATAPRAQVRVKGSR